MWLLKNICIAVFIGVPTAWLLTFMLTPLLWKLEPIFGIELAGHSGPADWIFITNVIALPTVIFVWLSFYRKHSS